MSEYLQSAMWADDPDVRRRVGVGWVDQADAGQAAQPPDDPTVAVHEQRYQWSKDWGTIPTETGITDGQIRDAVKRVWPVPVPEVP